MWKRMIPILLAILTMPTFADQEGGSTKEAEAKEKPKLTLKLGGRLHLDYAWYDDERDDGGKVRRGRLEAKGAIGSDWDYKVQFEFSGDSPELRDGFLQYKALGPGATWIGNYKQPSSLEVLSSSNTITFVERAMVTALAEDRRMGVGYSTSASRYVAMASVYGDEPNGAVEGSGVIARGVWIPINEGGRVVQLGGSASWSEPDDGIVRIRVRPESGVTDDRILDTGQIRNVEHVDRIGLEGGVQLDRFSAQAEYVQSSYSRSGGDPDLAFDGWYAYASWFLTRDRRAYEGSEGVFGKVSPSGRSGAWEVALRFSTLDLTDEDVRGGSGDIWTAGVNWYANEYLRFMANVGVVDTDDVAGNDDPNIVQVRMQIVF